MVDKRCEMRHHDVAVSMAVRVFLVVVVMAFPPSAKLDRANRVPMIFMVKRYSLSLCCCRLCRGYVMGETTAIQKIVTATRGDWKQIFRLSPTRPASLFERMERIFLCRTFVYPCAAEQGDLMICFLRIRRSYPSRKDELLWPHLVRVVVFLAF